MVVPCSQDEAQNALRLSLDPDPAGQRYEVSRFSWPDPCSLPALSCPTTSIRNSLRLLQRYWIQFDFFRW
jgi:hypothetical protein